MSEHLMNTREIAEYLGVHEKQIYALIKAGRIPCTRVTGKWIFPKKLLDEWIENKSRSGLKQARTKSSQIGSALLAAGSNDPLMDMLSTATKKDHPDFFVFTANTGSVNGLKTLNTGLTDIAFSHLYDAESGEYNIPYLAEYLPEIKPVVVNIFHREIGFLVQPAKASRINGFESLVNEGVRFVNRQKGSGTRHFLDHQLQKMKISPADIDGYENEVYTHFEIGLAVSTGEADTGIASAAAASLLGLAFQPFNAERFDMIMDQSTYFQPGVQSLIAALNSPAFRSRVGKIGGYDFKDSGKIIYSRQ